MSICVSHLSDTIAREVISGLPSALSAPTASSIVVLALYCCAGQLNSSSKAAMPCRVFHIETYLVLLSKNLVEAAVHGRFNVLSVALNFLEAG